MNRLFGSSQEGFCGAAKKSCVMQVLISDDGNRGILERNLRSKSNGSGIYKIYNLKHLSGKKRLYFD